MVKSMKSKMKAFACVLSAIMLASSGCIKLENEDRYETKPSETISEVNYTGFYNQYNSSLYIKFNGIIYEVKARQYDLPLKIDGIKYGDDCIQFLNIDEDAVEKLKKNGFVVSKPIEDLDDFQEAYSKIVDEEIPVFITTDSMLHMYHMFFDSILMNVEIEYLKKNAIEMTERLIERIEDIYRNNEGDVKEWARKDIAYLYVAYCLFKGNESVNVPSYVKSEVYEELRQIEEHKGKGVSPIFSYGENVYCEDYSQYLPRGHYDTPSLKNYFRGMMWYGRMSFLVKSDEHTGMAVILSDILVKNDDISNRWKNIYEVTAFFVGISDDLTPYEYSKAAEKVIGNSSDYSLIKEKMKELKNELRNIRKPKILSTFLSEGKNFTEETQGLRLMGQRFIPDSYIFHRLTHDRTENRMIPKGLDVMAVLDSEVAEKLLEDDKKRYSYECKTKSYDYNLQSLKMEFSKTKEWGRNLYWGWLFTLKSLNKNFTAESYPTFMRNEAWQKEKLNTNLASWAELRHDTILYGKQSYTSEKGMSPIVKELCELGYVEPIPEFYQNLADLAEGTKNGLKSMNFLSKNCELAINKIIEMCKKFREFSVKELKGEKLMMKDMEYIRKIPSHISYVTTYLKSDVEYYEDVEKTTIIADAHSDPNSNQCLEIGIGYISFLVVCCANGEDVAFYVGPVFTYYEFTHPMSDRLTDERWRDVLLDNPPERPLWSNDFM